MHGVQHRNYYTALNKAPLREFVVVIQGIKG